MSSILFYILFLIIMANFSAIQIGDRLMSFHFDASINTAAAACKISLYHIDSRANDNMWNIKPEIELSIYPGRTVEKINDLICNYFQVYQRSEKNVLKSVFFSPDFNLFKFTRMEDTNIMCIKVSGGKDQVFKECPAEFIAVEKKTEKLSISNKSRFTDDISILDYDKINAENSKDYSIVALFNSHSFKRLIECNDTTSLNWTRTLEKIEQH